MALLRNQVSDTLASMQALGVTTIKVDAKGRTMDIDPSKDVEYATDKEQVKIVPCRNASCLRPMVVTTFFMPDKAECRSCRGDNPDAGVASVAAPIAGSTEPAKAMNLADVLLNPQFAEVICPICVEPMELKSVNHNDQYGPGHWTPSSKGPAWVQDAKGETVMHQCNKCLLVITIANTARYEFKRQNEVRRKQGRGANVWADVDGVREAA
ncbi:MAG TPA: hypothetical protein VI300_32150 [Solirubrobacter sp.]